MGSCWSGCDDVESGDGLQREREKEREKLKERERPKEGGRKLRRFSCSFK